MEPLSSKIRPEKLEDFVGQNHLVGKGKPISEAINKKYLFSFIFWGPPGCGKTTLARIYANNLEAELFELSAVSAGKDDIKKIIKPPNKQKRLDEKAKVLFLDEIHRFNKAQQDFLLPYVESGEITLIGATTENPSFEIIPALLSRCRIFVMNRLNEKEIKEIIKKIDLDLKNETTNWLVEATEGDARKAINLIESTKNLYGKINLKTLQKTLQSNHSNYGKKSEEHYNTISAFIKSMRAGDENATIYYLARMIESGEDPKFIARRMVIFASEDVGLAQPTALVVANAVFNAVQSVGLPECAINLAHGAVYLSQCKKNRSAYEGLRKAQEDVKKYGNLPTPLKIRNPETKLMKEVGYGKNYKAYDKSGLMPKKLKDKKYFK